MLLSMVALVVFVFSVADDLVVCIGGGVGRGK